MSEIVTTYLLANPEQALPMDREEFYKEQLAAYRKTGKPTRAVEIVQVLLFTPDKDIILQKRARTKNHNPRLIDKTVGGHVVFGDEPTHTVMYESLQELQVSSFVLNTKEDFERTYKLLHKYVAHSALIQFVDSRIDNFTKIFNTGPVEIANKYDFYIGVYGGSVRLVDREASGILFYEYEHLLNEIKESPQDFTFDLNFFLTQYASDIKLFLKSLDESLK